MKVKNMNHTAKHHLHYTFIVSFQSETGHTCKTKSNPNPDFMQIRKALQKFIILIFRLIVKIGKKKNFAKIFEIFEENFCLFRAPMPFFHDLLISSVFTVRKYKVMHNS